MPMPVQPVQQMPAMGVQNVPAGFYQGQPPMPMPAPTGYSNMPSQGNAFGQNGINVQMTTEEGLPGIPKFAPGTVQEIQEQQRLMTLAEQIPKAAPVSPSLLKGFKIIKLDFIVIAIIQFITFLLFSILGADPILIVVSAILMLAPAAGIFFAIKKSRLVIPIALGMGVLNVLTIFLGDIVAFLLGVFMIVHTIRLKKSIK
jgi:hypothetical protein